MEKWSDLTIEEVWFDDKNIYIRTNDGTEKHHPLRWFPSLWNATREELEHYEISKWGDSIHWRDLNEDLSLEGFFTYNKDEIEKQKNPVAKVFDQFPSINISKFAELAKINRSLLASYVCNEKTPGVKNKKLIEDAIHELGRELMAVKL